jgi:hypothetical protein
MEEKIKQTNPTLHRYLFTVTTFSKLLAMLLFILFPFVGFYLGMQYQEKVKAIKPTVALEVKKTININPKLTLTPTQTPTSIPTPVVDSNWKIYNDKIDNYYSIYYPSDWYIVTEGESHCVWFSDIKNYLDIPSKIDSQSHSIIEICLRGEAIPTSFAYTNGSSANNTIKPYSINGYTGIMGELTSSLGLAEKVLLKNPTTGHIEFTKTIGENTIFNKMLSTFRFTRFTN